MPQEQKYLSFLENVPCNTCGSDEFDILIPPRYDRAKPEDITETFRSSGDEVLIDQLVRCRCCGLQYLNPRLKGNIVIDGYSQGTDETFISQVDARERTFEKALHIIEKNFPQKGNLLDVGTAGGSFPGVAQKRGWQAFACEPNRWLADWGSKRYGIKIHPGTIFDMKLHDSMMDVITLWDVLEHTPDPRSVVKECCRILKPDGIIVINYPDIHSLIARLMGKKWVFLLSVHLYYYTLRTLRALLLQEGLEVFFKKNYWQTLQLGYILKRMKAYFRLPAVMAAAVVKKIGLSQAEIPYWMGQVMVMARRKKDK